jgi:predicted nucleic acid-binding protein
MTVLDTSAVVDLLLGDGAAPEVERLIVRERMFAAPDVLVFEVLAVLRRNVMRGGLSPARADAAVADLGDLPAAIYPSLWLRTRAWTLRDNLTAADGLFVALAEQLGEPLATKDRGLAIAARRHAGIDALELIAR